MPNETDAYPKHSWWSKFKSDTKLDVYSVFGRQNKNKDGKIKGIGKARAKLIATNLFTAGLINIYYRIKQDKYRANRGKASNGKPITQTHSSPLERKIDYLSETCMYLEIGYRNFPEDLNFFLRQTFDLARTERALDESFPVELQKAKDDPRVQPKFEAILEQAQNL